MKKSATYWRIVLPKGTTSPTGSIYKHYDIVSQQSALWNTVDSSGTVTSPGPFTLRYRTAAGRVVTRAAREVSK